jgi:methyl-accepting chemotaxis protein
MPDTSPNSGNGGLRGLVLFPFTVVPAVIDGLRSMPRMAGAIEDLVNDRLDRLSAVSEGLERAAESLRQLAETAAMSAHTETTGAMERISGATETPARLEEALAQLAEMRRTLEQLATDFANVPAHVDRAASAVEKTNEYLDVAVPVMQNLAHVAAPLAGTSERLGHLVDRLPKGRRSRASSAAVTAPPPTRPLPR